MADVSVEARERMRTEHIREDRTVEGWRIETHYTPCKGIADANGYLRVLVDEEGYDTETRILHETLNSIGWVQGSGFERCAIACEELANQYRQQAREGDNSGASDHKEDAALECASEIRAIAALSVNNQERAEAGAWQPMDTAKKQEGLLTIWIDWKNGTTEMWNDCYHDAICDEWRTSRPSGHLRCVPARFVTNWIQIPSPHPPTAEGQTKPKCVIYLDADQIDVAQFYRAKGFQHLPTTPTMTGAEIRACGWKKNNYQMYIDVTPMVPVGDTEAIALVDGMKFFCIPPATW